MKKIILITTVLVMTTLSMGCRHVSDNRVTEPMILQTVSEFYRPESCTFSLDGTSLFVTNCGAGYYGVDEDGNPQFSLAHEKGAVSKLSVAEDGTLTMVDPQFFPKTSGALGIATLPVATETFPAGTLFFNAGFFMQTDANDQYIDNQKELDPGIFMLDPNSGKLLGKILLTMDGAVSQAVGTPIFVPNGMCFDGEGNLYFGETGGSTKFIRGLPEENNQTGAIRIPHAAIDALAAGKPADGIKMLKAPAINGVAFDHASDSLIMLTFTGSEGGDALYRVSLKDFEAGTLPKPFVSAQGKLDGVVITPAGTMLVTDVTNQSLIKVNQQGEVETLDFGGKRFNGPSDISIKTLADGSSIVILPEQEFTAPKAWTQNVHVIKLPAGY